MAIVLEYCSIAPRLLCRAEGRYYLMVLSTPIPGDYVAVLSGSWPIVQRYYGQACLGVVYPLPRRAGRRVR